MQLRCSFCQTMFALSREEMLAALEHMEENKQVYYEAHCPKCRRGNRVERARMERFFPEWKNAIKTMSKESAKLESINEKSDVDKVAVQPVKMTKALAKREKKHTVRSKTAPALKNKSPLKSSLQNGKSAETKKK